MAFRRLPAEPKSKGAASSTSIPGAITLEAAPRRAWSSFMVVNGQTEGWMDAHPSRPRLDPTRVGSTRSSLDLSTPSQRSDLGYPVRLRGGPHVKPAEQRVPVLHQSPLVWHLPNYRITELSKRKKVPSCGKSPGASGASASACSQEANLNLSVPKRHWQGQRGTHRPVISE